MRDELHGERVTTDRDRFDHGCAVDPHGVGVAVDVKSREVNQDRTLEQRRHRRTEGVHGLRRCRVPNLVECPFEGGHGVGKLAIGLGLSDPRRELHARRNGGITICLELCTLVLPQLRVDLTVPPSGLQPRQPLLGTPDLPSRLEQRGVRAFTVFSQRRFFINVVCEKHVHHDLVNLMARNPCQPTARVQQALAARTHVCLPTSSILANV